jgi:hypothetical protein
MNNNKTITVFIESDGQQRLKLHRTLFKNNIHSASLHLPGFSCETRRFYKCPHCRHSLPVVSKYYCYGSEDNNFDESYFWICPTCDETVRWEPNYDGHDEVKCINKKNAVCIGEYFKGYQYHYTGLVSDDNTYDVMPPHHLIPAPTEILNRKDLGQYIATVINSL